MFNWFDKFLYNLRTKFLLERSAVNTRETIEAINKGIEIKGVNLWVLVLAIFIASLGLNTNSTAVIIGAMLVSPLMGPIMGLGMGLAINSDEMVKKSIRNFLLAVAISLITSALYFLVSPFKDAGSELVARTSPTVYDVLIAIAGGLAGIVAGTSSLRNSNVIPGVAIATALMPPLCTAGYGIATLQKDFFIGALYLFFINTVFISLSTYVIVKLLRFPSFKTEESVTRKAIRVSVWMIVIATIIPSIFFTYHIVRKSLFEKRAHEFIKKEVENESHWVVSTSLKYKGEESKIDLIVLSKDTSKLWQHELQHKLAAYHLDGVQLNVLHNFETGSSMRANILDKLKTVEYNNTAIKEVYDRLQEVEKKQQQQKAYSIQQQQVIANEMKIWMGDRFQNVSIGKAALYNGSGATLDSCWQIVVGVKKGYPKTEQKKLDSWLKLKLQPDSVQLIVK